MTAQFLQYFGPVTVRHGLGDEIADSIGEQGISPEDLDARWLVDEMRLMRQHNRHQPMGVLERYQSAGTSFVAAEFVHLLEEGRIV